MPLQVLGIHPCRNARGLEVLSTLDSLEVLSLPIDSLTLPEEEKAAIDQLVKHPRLRQVSDRVASTILSLETDLSKHNFWPRWKAARAMSAQLRSAGIEFELILLAQGNGFEFQCLDPAFDDLSVVPFRELNIRRLSCYGSGISDLSPLKGTDLETLVIGDTQVSDVSPLEGMSNLWHLSIQRSPQLTDITPLRHLSSLQNLYLAGSAVEDLSPLRGMSKSSAPSPSRRAPTSMCWMSFPTCSSPPSNPVAGRSEPVRDAIPGHARPAGDA